jgi:TRAP-type mannitol/chloroaromatic compound transport system permease small subunit
VSSIEQHTPQIRKERAPNSGAPLISYFRSFTQALNIAGTLLILIMAIAVNLDIGGRDFFNQPIPGVTEFIGLSIVAVVFLQMANTLHEDRHVSNDIIIRLVAASRPRLTAAIYTIFHLVGAVLMMIIVIYVWPIVVEHYERGYYAGTAEVVEIKIWPFMAVVVIGAATTALQFLLDARRMALRAAGRAAA